MKWFDEATDDEKTNNGYTQRFKVGKVVYREKTEHQDIFVFENPDFGLVLALDGIIQTTEKDEFTYHEMMAHVPLFAHGSARRVLIVGGGDGGTLREVLRHGIEEAILVDIDRTVIDVCRRYLPGLSNGAFDDPRTRLVIADGVEFTARHEPAFDVIIVDSTDPLGPGEVLFSEDFYANCRSCLNPGGVMVTQNGVPFFQAQAVTNTYRRLGPLFADFSFYLTAVPTYLGGVMTLGWATDDLELRNLPLSTIADRHAAAGFETGYYSPAVHLAAFSLPPYVAALMK